MPDAYRVTIRLSPELYAQLEARGSHGQPLAAIVRDALEQYLPRQPEQPPSPQDLAMTVAAMAATIAEIQVQVQELAARVDALADSWPPTAATAAATRQPRAASAQAPSRTRQPVAATTGDPALSPTPQQRAGRPKGRIRQRIETLLREHPEGLSAEQIRAHINPERPIGDILSGMRRTQAVRTQRRGKEIRYFHAQATPPATRRG